MIDNAELVPTERHRGFGRAAAKSGPTPTFPIISHRAFGPMGAAGSDTRTIHQSSLESPTARLTFRIGGTAVFRHPIGNREKEWASTVSGGAAERRLLTRLPDDQTRSACAASRPQRNRRP